MRDVFAQHRHLAGGLGNLVSEQRQLPPQPVQELGVEASVAPVAPRGPRAPLLPRILAKRGLVELHVEGLLDASTAASTDVVPVAASLGTGQAGLVQLRLRLRGISLDDRLLLNEGDPAAAVLRPRRERGLLNGAALLHDVSEPGGRAGSLQAPGDHGRGARCCTRPAGTSAARPDPASCALRLGLGRRTQQAKHRRGGGARLQSGARSSSSPP
mmetsp:Transcript_31363/g.66738  ORF Transcript_31363/g.66738 Transcript_31363/m.66738 type:complete len:214 (-) Transcript_31363:3-644(-)